jgi:hypothetical protein
VSDDEAIDVGLGRELIDALGELEQDVEDMSCDPTLEICSPLMLAVLPMSGTAASMASMVTAPDV